jgi:hypothetical protein
MTATIMGPEKLLSGRLVAYFIASTAETPEKSQGCGSDLLCLEHMEGKELKSLPEPSLDADASFSSDEGGDGFQTSGLRGQQRAGWSIALLMLGLCMSFSSILSNLCNRPFFSSLNDSVVLMPLSPEKMKKNLHHGAPRTTLEV